MRYRLFVASFLLLMLASFSAQGALAKYSVRRTLAFAYDDTSPRVEFTTDAGLGTVVIDNDGGLNSPIMKKLWVVVGSGGRTTDLPGLSGFIWFNRQTTEGKPANQQGTGTIASTIEWGDVDGWTTKGGIFCHAVPSSICELATAADNETFPGSNLSSHYHFYTWTFHGTGYVANPFIHRTGVTGLGNVLYNLRGFEDGGGEVPALPLIGLLAVGGSVIAGGVVAMRRKK